MAFGSGSSLASDCWIRRGGRPSPLQACNEGRAKRLHQVSSSKPTTHSGLTSERRISRSRRLFSFVLGVGAGDPALGAQPAHSHALQGDTHGLRAHPLFGYPLLEARFGGQSECPQARVLRTPWGFDEASRATARPAPRRRRHGSSWVEKSAC